MRAIETPRRRRIWAGFGALWPAWSRAATPAGKPAIGRAMPDYAPNYTPDAPVYTKG
jgi:hypothetical protein